jgi:hypothetical protein
MNFLQLFALKGLARKLILFAVSKFFTDKMITKIVIAWLTLGRDLANYLAPKTTTDVDDRIVSKMDDVILDLKKSAKI